VDRSFRQTHTLFYVLFYAFTSIICTIVPVPSVIVLPIVWSTMVWILVSNLGDLFPPSDFDNFKDNIIFRQERTSNLFYRNPLFQVSRDNCIPTYVDGRDLGGSYSVIWTKKEPNHRRGVLASVPVRAESEI
jgi:hypothetical protein